MGFFDRLFGSKKPVSGMTREEATQLMQSNANFADLVFFSLDHGIASIEDGSGPLIPFVVEQSGGEKKLNRFMADHLEECIASARHHIASLGSSVSAFAFAHDGYCTLEGTKYDAIFVEAELRSHPGTIIMAQRYKPKSDGQRFERIGNAAFLGVKPSSF